jgi:hypothetical protein
VPFSNSKETSTLCESLQFACDQPVSPSRPLYALAGLLVFIQYDFLEEMQQFTFPIGIIVFPFVHFNVNINIPRSMTASSPVLYAIAAVFGYALSGCITGLAGTMLFNFIAGLLGGIDARFVKTADD